MEKFDEMVKLLKENVCHVRFEKVDGTMRDMKCTLMPEYLPESDGLYKSGFDPQKPVNTSTIAVWSVDDNGWRSFRVNSVATITH